MNYYCIGEKLSHSFSKEIHSFFGNDSYTLAEVSPQELSAFVSEKKYGGLNVTVPYKQAIMPLLHEISESAMAIGAVNTVVNRNGKLAGYNTDFDGLSMLISHYGIDLCGKIVLILGSGGTSKTAVAVCKALGAADIFVASRGEKPECISYETAKTIKADIIINTTPCGMYPQTDDAPVDIKNFASAEVVIDVVYNPQQTKLMRSARANGIKAYGGLYMLVAQAAKAEELFFGKKISVDEIDNAYIKAKELYSYADIVASTARGQVTAPPSKSMLHRYLICAALSKNTSYISNVSFSDDICSTINCLKNLGAEISLENGGLKVGTIDVKKYNGKALQCGDSATTLRFLSAVAMTLGKKVFLQGSRKLMSRPMDEYAAFCRANGILFETNGDTIAICGNLKAGNYSVRGDVSSQFLSGILIALASVEGESTVCVNGPLESAPYVALTLQALKESKIKVEQHGNEYGVSGGFPLLESVLTEGDCSAAANYAAYNCAGGSVTVNGLSENTLQGDAVYEDYFSMLEHKTPTLDISDCPDLAPILMAVASIHHGARFTGTGRLKFKESDRGAAMAEELKKFGVHTEIAENSITVAGKALPPAGPLFGHNDHRIVMALALLCTVAGGRIYGAAAVAKSVPDYFETLKSLGIEVKLFGDKTWNKI